MVSVTVGWCEIGSLIAGWAASSALEGFSTPGTEGGAGQIQNRRHMRWSWWDAKVWLSLCSIRVVFVRGLCAVTF